MQFIVKIYFSKEYTGLEFIAIMLYFVKCHLSKDNLLKCGNGKETKD